MTPTRNTEQIKSAADLVSIVGGYVKLMKCGSQLRGLCPFHEERHASFYVHPAKQLYHCHGCHAGGDVFDFIRRIERVDFPRALEIVAHLAGVPLVYRILTAEEQTHMVPAADLEAIEHLSKIDSISLMQARAQWSNANPDDRDWIRRDLEESKALCIFIVAALAHAQMRDGDFPAVGTTA